MKQFLDGRLWVWVYVRNLQAMVKRRACEEKEEQKHQKKGYEIRMG